MDQQNNSQPTLNSSKSWSISYNAPFTLSFCILSAIVLGINSLMGNQLNQVLALLPDLRFANLYRLLTYVLCHVDFQHYIGNTLFLLMLGPILEEKYGGKQLLVMTVITAIVTGLINALFFSDSIIGASGIVFMFIVLASVVNIKEKEIPLTFLFIVIIYIGGELVKSFDQDNISQFGHILGGVCGGVFGFLLRKK